MRHTWREWSLITAAVICRARLSSGDRSHPLACTLVSSWVQEESVEGSRAARAVSCRTHGPDENRTRYMADVPGCRAIIPKKRRGSGERSRQRKPALPHAPDLGRGARTAAGLRPFLGPPPSEHCPSFTNPTRTPGSLFIFDTYPLWTLYLYYLWWINASPRPDATPTVSVVCSSCHNVYIKTHIQHILQWMNIQETIRVNSREEKEE